jgi:hypothetical protein
LKKVFDMKALTVGKKVVVVLDKSHPDYASLPEKLKGKYLKGTVVGVDELGRVSVVFDEKGLVKFDIVMIHVAVGSKYPAKILTVKK